LVELAMCVFMTGYMASSERFFGAYAVAAAPYLARDLDEWVRARRWPAWTAPAWARAGLAGLAILGGGAAEWARPDRPLAIAVDMNRFPVRAMDFIERHGLRGHGLSQTLAAVADSFGYRWIGGGTEKVARAFAEAAGDSAVRVALGAEVERLTASSPLDARAHSLAATLAISEQRFDAARAALEAALHVD